MPDTEITELDELGAEKVSGVGNPANGTPWLLLKATDIAADPESPHTEVDKGETEDILAALKGAQAMGYCGTEDCDLCKERLGPIYEFLIKRKLTAADRKKIPKGDFAIPEKAPASGSYPINDESHARNALSRASGKPVEARVKAAVRRKYPNIGKEALEKSPGVPDFSVTTPQEAGHVRATAESGLAGPMTAGVKPIPGSASYALGGESTYEIPVEAKETTHPPLTQRPREEAHPVAVTDDHRGHVFQGANKDSWDLEVVEKQNWVSLDNALTPQSPDVESANNTVLRCMADTYCQLKACMAAQKQDPDGMSDPMDAQVWAHLEDVCATLKNALIDQAFDVAGLDAQSLKTAGNGANTSEEETMTTVTKEDLASAIAESTMAALKADRKAQKTKEAKKAKKGKKMPPWMKKPGAAEKNANNNGDITAEEMNSRVKGHADADDVNAIPDGGNVHGGFVNKEKKGKQDKVLKSVEERLVELQGVVQKMAGRPRSGGPVLDGVPHVAGLTPTTTNQSSSVRKSGEEPEIERLRKAVEEDKRTHNDLMLDQHSRELQLALFRHGHITGEIGFVPPPPMAPVVP